MMMRTLAPRRPVAATVAVALLIAVPNVAAWAQPTGATLEGRVLAADGATPRPGAVVELAVDVDGPAWTSAPTGRDGSFRLEGAPAGTYALLVRDGEEVYVAAERFPVAAGSNGPVELSVQPRLVPAQSGGSKIPTWGQWLIAGGIAIGGAYLFEQVMKDDTEPSASPF
jgi:hypothetical protein